MNSPGTQFDHAWHSVAFCVLEKVASGQGSQNLSEMVVAAIDTNCPGMHWVSCVHSVAFVVDEKSMSRLQSSHILSDCVVGSTETNCPDGHSVRVVHSMAFSESEKLTSIVHSWHCRSVELVPFMDTNSPGWHSVQGLQLPVHDIDSVSHDGSPWNPSAHWQTISREFSSLKQKVLSGLGASRQAPLSLV